MVLGAMAAAMTLQLSGLAKSVVGRQQGFKPLDAVLNGRRCNIAFDHYLSRRYFTERKLLVQHEERLFGLQLIGIGGDSRKPRLDVEETPET